MSTIRMRYLGQSDFRFELAGQVVYFDPHLSDSVERAEGVQFRRLRPVPMAPADICDASAVVVSRVHLDHCDRDTLVPIALRSSKCRFFGLREVTDALPHFGINERRLVTMNDAAVMVSADIVLHPVPAAHKSIEKDHLGFLRCLGFVMESQGKKVLHTGDSCVADRIIDRLKSLGGIDVACLPVNECNFYRDKAGIIGNMPVRDAFRLAEDLAVPRVVPMHYDMFAPNQTYRDEIEVIYARPRPPFMLDFDPTEI